MKVKVENNWEDLTYFFNGKEIPRDSKGYVILQNGDKCKFFPEPHYTSYGDMGHTYHVTTHKFFVEIDFNNQKLNVLMDDLEIKDLVVTGKIKKKVK